MNTPKGKFMTHFDEYSMPTIFLDKKYDLAKKLWDYTRDNYEVMNLLAKNLEQIVDLDYSDQLEVRDWLVFVYLLLGQDQDAYDFIKFWALNDPEIAEMKKGQNKYEEFDDYQMLSLAFKVALLAIKMRNYKSLADKLHQNEKLEKRIDSAENDTTLAEIRENS